LKPGTEPVLPVIGQYAGALNNAGETLRLCDIAGQTIQELSTQ
jgi:hypothetical protein